MKRKILYSILSVFMSVAMFVGVSFFVGDTLNLNDDEVTVAAIKPTKKENWSSHTDSSGMKIVDWIDGRTMKIEISSAGGFAYFAKMVNENKKSDAAYYKEAHVELTKNISLSNYYWTPIGDWDSKFAGTFDGQGHTISGLYLDGNLKGAVGDSSEGRNYAANYGGYVTDNNANHASGLFGVCESSKAGSHSGVILQNFTLSGGHSNMITWAKNVGDDQNNYYIGAVVGYGKYTTVDQVVVSHSIHVEMQGEDPTQNDWTGTNIARELSDVYVGGIAGQCDYIFNSIVQAKEEKWNGTGGKFGIRLNFTDQMMQHYESGFDLDPSLVGDYHVGGIVGVAGVYGSASPAVHYCYNYQKIETDSKDPAFVDKFYTGGIAGYSRATIQYCYNFGNLTAWETVYNNHDFDESDIYYMGGIAGKSTDNFVAYSVNYGNIDCKTIATVGGISGESGQVTYCTNFGKVDVKGTEGTVTIDTIHITGGIVGLVNTNTISGCVNYGDVMGMMDDNFESTGNNPENLRAYGGIVGQAVTSTISNCINYGDLYAGHAWSGGIAGVAKTDTTLSDCVNIGTVTFVYHQPTIGYWQYRSAAICLNTNWWGTSFDQTITNCYYLDGSQRTHNSSSGVTETRTGTKKDLNSLSSFQFYNKASNWSAKWNLLTPTAGENDYVDGFGLLFSNLPIQYVKGISDDCVGNKVKTLTYSLIPSPAIHAFSIYVPNSDLEQFVYVEMDNVVDYSVDYSRDGTEMMPSILNDTTFNYEDNSIYIPFLRGVAYDTGYNNLKPNFSVSLNDNGKVWFYDLEFELKLWSTSSFYDISTSSFDEWSSGTKFEYQICSGSGVFWLELTAEKKEVTLEVDCDDAYGTVYRSDGTTDLHGLEITYNEDVNFVVQPKLGYRFSRLAVTDSGSNNLNENTSGSLGIYEGSFNTKNLISNTVYAKFALVVYSGNIYYKESIDGEISNFSGQENGLYKSYSGKNFKGNFKSEEILIANIATYYASNGATENTPLNIDNIYQNRFFTFGYSYSFYIEGEETGEAFDEIGEFDLTVPEAYNETKFKLSALGWVFDNRQFNIYCDFQALVEQFNDVTSNQINISVVRTPVEYAIEVVNLAEMYKPYNSFSTFTDGYGGTVELSRNYIYVEGQEIKKAHITESIGFEGKPENGFIYYGLSFFQDVNLGMPTSIINLKNKNYKDQSDRDVFNIIWQAYKTKISQEKEEYFLDKNTHKLTLYAFFGLQTYTTTGSVEGLNKTLVVDGERVKLSENNFGTDDSPNYTVSLKSEQRAKDDFSVQVVLNEMSKDIRFYAPITLQAYDFEDFNELEGYKFVGFYSKIGDDEFLISDQKKYIYTITPQDLFWSNTTWLAKDKTVLDWVGKQAYIDAEKTIQFNGIEIVARYIKFNTGIEPEVLKEEFIDENGDKVEKDVYLIETPYQLAWVSNQSATDEDGFSGKIVRLACDIDLNGVTLLPIGTQSKPFKGEFDGNGFKIFNLGKPTYSWTVFKQYSTSLLRKYVYTISTINGQENLHTKISTYSVNHSGDQTLQGIVETDEQYDGSCQEYEVLKSSRWLMKNSGLFGVTNGAYIHDFTLVDGQVVGYANVGAVVGNSTDTTIENVNNFSCDVAVKDVVFYDVLGRVLSDEVYITEFTNAEAITTYKYYRLNILTWEYEIITVEEYEKLSALEKASYIRFLYSAEYSGATFTADGAFDTQQNVANIAGIAKGTTFVKVSNYADNSYENGVFNIGGLAGRADSYTKLISSSPLRPSRFEIIYSKFVLSFDEGTLSCASPAQGRSGTIHPFANGEFETENCYYRMTDLSNVETTYVYGATMIDDDGNDKTAFIPCEYTGIVSWEILDPEVWLKLYGKYVLKDIYWA